MKLLAIFILYQENDTDVKILQKECDLQDFNFYQRRHIESFLTFSARTIVERTDRGIKQSIDLKEKVDGIIHVYVRQDKLAAIVISDSNYPKRVAHSLLSKVMYDFIDMYSSDEWKNMAEESGTMKSLSETLKKYQNPQDADPLMSLQKDLDETKDIMFKTLDNVLKRGENIDILLEKSRDLSWESKILYNEAKRQNRCCNLL